MIIKKLILSNFRVFHGTHEIELEPRNTNSEKKPIILFGGLNGAGKTSILTAIRLALYGRLAFDGLHRNQDYVEQLTAFIHNGIDINQQPDNASVNLVFTYNKDGEESEFTVIRCWQRGEKDQLTLLRNGNPLSELNYEQCQGFLNELIPHGIADLFFFDGEKIASLAEDESGMVLQTAVRRLLGLDLIAKLRNDLSIYLRRQNTDQNSTQQEKINELEEKSRKLAQSAENYRYAADLKKISIDLISSDIRKHEGLLAAQGGSFALTKAQEQARVDELIKERAQLEKTIRHELETTLPYSLASKTLDKLLIQLDIESEIKKRQHFSSEFNIFINDLKHNEHFDSVKTRQAALRAVEIQLGKYLSKQPKGNVLLDISERECGILHRAIKTESPSSRERFQKARNTLGDIEYALEEAASNIERAPEDEQLLGIFNTIRELDTKHQNALIEYKSLLEQAKLSLQQQLECARQLQRHHDKERLQYNSSSAIINAQSTLATLDRYAEALTIARVKKLEEMFVLAYQRLARKDDLQISARINATTFDVELVDEQGITINRKSLSAGEKQIYAIAILEALAKTSGRQLPVIIDTPLGRLDSHHREKLIDHYFSTASHQVVLLSTDTEVNEHYFFNKLKPYISHAYQICFDGAKKSASLQPGYFWKNRKTEAC